MTIVGEAASFFTYQAFKAASLGEGLGGAIFSAARAAAIAGIVAEGSLVAGAGLAGIAIGEQILKNLEYTGADPAVAQAYRTPGNAGRIRLRAVMELAPFPEQEFENDFDSPVLAPWSIAVGDSVRFGVISGTPPVFTQYGQAGRTQVRQPLRVISVTKIDGSPVPELLKLPTYAPVFPAEPFKLPTTVPVSPEIPAFPITPTVVPNPANDPEQDDEKAKTPGVIVQIPETGQQIVFTPTGVVVQRYRSPATEQNEAPRIPPPPGTGKPAQQECPCPEGENKDEEIICRIKTLQKEILDDGFTEEIRAFGGSQCFEVLNLGKGFYKVECSAVTVPSNAKRISYPEPGIDTVFVGNIQFRISGSNTEPIPLRGVSQIILAPEGATGYVVSGALGFSINSLAYIRTKKDYIDNCNI